ncbi:uncharacterized protein [Fopius arisanus]|uniref:Uncharacterized protein n=1 Tax=Fopius arisanus TaxID=64838 RepID=A0A9R1U7I2_9HYME|nr:PREDICTED: uncharacterized protein LOC105270758 [Fopius arisanus]
MYKRPEECKQHSKKLTKTKKKRKRTVDIEDECDDRGSDYPQGIVKKKLTPRNRYVSAIDKGIDKIKPSINVRDQYSNSRHIQCLTENSPLHPGLFSNFQEKSKTGKKLKDRGDLSTDSESSSHSEEICSFDSDIDLSV